MSADITFQKKIQSIKETFTVFLFFSLKKRSQNMYKLYTIIGGIKYFFRFIFIYFKNELVYLLLIVSYNNFLTLYNVYLTIKNNCDSNFVIFFHLFSNKLTVNSKSRKKSH